MDQLKLDLPLRSAKGRDDFFVSASNALAVTMLDQPAQWPQGKMILEGPEGSGKSHLLHIWCADNTALQPALAPLEMPPEGANVAIDDIDQYAGDAEAETALFHLHNHVVNTGGTLLMTRTRTGAFDLPDLVSRLQATSVTKIDAPDDTLLQAVVLKHFSDRQLSPAPAAQAHLLRHMDRTFATAAQAVAALDDLSMARQKPITRAMVADVLEKLSPDA